MTVQQFHNSLRDNPIVKDYLAYMDDTLGGGYVNYYFEDGGQHYRGAPLPKFKYHNVEGNLHPVVWGTNSKTNMIQHLFGATDKLFQGMCIFGEFTGSISAGSYGSRQGFIRPYMKSKDSDRNEQWQYVISLRTGKKFLGPKYWTPANPETKMSFYQYLGLDKSAVRVIQKESQRILSEALETVIAAIQADKDYLEWKESDKTGDSATDVVPQLDLKEVYRAIASKVGKLRLDQEADEEIQCSIRHWGNWDHDYEDYDRDEDDYEDDDYEILSDASYDKMQKIIDEIKEKFPQVDIDWGTSEKNWIDFTITRITSESKIEEIKPLSERAKHLSTDFSKPGNDGDIYFSKREGDAVGIRLGDKLQMIYVFQEEPKLGRIQKSDKRWENMGPASEELLIDLRGREGGKILFDFVSTLEESVDEIKTTMISGTSGRTIDSLEDRKYQLKKDVKGARIGDYTNITLPKGTIIYNLPGGVHADHKSLKKYADRSMNKYFEKPTFSGIRVRSMPELLADIEKNSNVLESKEVVNEASYGGNEIYEIATPAPKNMLKEELEELFGNDYRNIVTEFSSPEGYESVLMFNITKNDISKIEKNIGDVLVWKLQLGGRKEII